MAAFDRAFEHTVGLEGGYSNHRSDKGGATKYGITEAVARENGYAGDMKELPIETAKSIYKKDYWDKMRLNDIANLSESIATELFDTGVNMGIRTAGKFLQRAINVLTFLELKLDGIIGTKTIQALSPFLKFMKVSEGVFLKMLNAQQCVRYIEIVEKNPSQSVFLKGWISKRVGL